MQEPSHWRGIVVSPPCCTAIVTSTPFANPSTFVSSQPLTYPSPLGSHPRYGNLGTIANEEGMVAVVFGATPLREESYAKPCGDVRDVDTPRSDGCDHKFERFI